MYVGSDFVHFDSCDSPVFGTFLNITPSSQAPELIHLYYSINFLGSKRNNEETDSLQW